MRQTGIEKTIERLERERDSIDRAIAALKEFSKSLDKVVPGRRRPQTKPVPLAKAE